MDVAGKGKEGTTSILLKLNKTNIFDQMRKGALHFGEEHRSVGGFFQFFLVNIILSKFPVFQLFSPLKCYQHVSYFWPLSRFFWCFLKKSGYFFYSANLDYFIVFDLIILIVAR